MSEENKGSIGKKIISVLLIFFGALFFFGGFYLLPIGTDAWMYFWIQIVAKGDWLMGDILANVAALGMMLIGGVILWHEGRSPFPRERKPREKKGGKRK